MIFPAIFAKRKGPQSLIVSLNNRKKDNPNLDKEVMWCWLLRVYITILVACYDKCLWIGAKLNATNSLTGMFDLKPCKENITVGDKKNVLSQKGLKNIAVKQPSYENKRVILQKVHYVPDLICNPLLDMCKFKWCRNFNHWLGINHQEGLMEIMFDKVIKSANNHLHTIKAFPILITEHQKISDTIMPTITKTV